MKTSFKYTSNGQKQWLPLKTKTPAEWARLVLKEPLKLLSDHAYLERKAATNALQLLNRWPEPHYPQGWVETLSGVARDEAAHLNSVTRLLKKRGGRLERSHRNQYASDLHQLVRKGKGPDEITDLLLVSALIEARSCERFSLLAKQGGDEELSTFYKSLWSSELNHYQIFLNLAGKVRPPGVVQFRWQELLKKESEIMEVQPPGPRMHSGFK